METMERMMGGDDAWTVKWIGDETTSMQTDLTSAVSNFQMRQAGGQFSREREIERGIYNTSGQGAGVTSSAKSVRLRYEVSCTIEVVALPFAAKLRWTDRDQTTMSVACVKEVHKARFAVMECCNSAWGTLTLAVTHSLNI